MEQRERFDELDGWRGIAALLVLVFHAYSQIRRPWPGTAFAALAMSGPTAVGWFFALSGFVIYRPIACAVIAGTAPTPARAFLVRRAARLLPLYYLVLAVIWFVPLLRPATSPGDLLLHLAFLHTYRADTFYGLLLPAWSLAVEGLFYLLMAGVSLALWRLAQAHALSARRALVYGVPAMFFGVGLVARVALALASVAPDNLPWQQNLLTFAPCFTGGLLVAALSADGATIGRRLALTLRVGGLAIILSALWPALVGPLALLPLWPYASGFALVIASTVLAPRVGRWLRVTGSRPMVLLGAWSYGIYLWHAPLIKGAAHLGLLTNQPAAFAADVAALIVLTLGLATLTYRYLERPMLRAGARLARQMSGRRSTGGDMPQSDTEVSPLPRFARSSNS